MKVELNPNDIVIEPIVLMPDDQFSAKKYAGASYGVKKFYIPGNKAFLVYLVYSKNPALNHEKIARILVENDPELKKAYEKEKSQKEYLLSYKDFLINNQEALSVADSSKKSKPQLVCGENNNVGTINKIIGQYLLEGYKFVETSRQVSSAPGRY